MDQHLPPTNSNNWKPGHREIVLGIKLDDFSVQSCIYKIGVGDCYYIGATRSFAKRMAEHRRAINKLLTEFCSRGTYAKVIYHLLVNPEIRELPVEMIESCELVDLYDLERKYHLESLSDKACLNVFYHHRTRIKALSLPLPNGSSENSPATDHPTN